MRGAITGDMRGDIRGDSCSHISGDSRKTSLQFAGAFLFASRTTDCQEDREPVCAWGFHDCVVRTGLCRDAQIVLAVC